MEGDDEMQIYKLNFILVMMLILTSKILSSTLAMNVTEVSSSDTALIYKWNFNVNDKTDNFDFSLIDNIITEQSKGSKSFTFSSGGSDVDIDYSVKMGMQDLLNDINESKSGEQYLPLIFKVTSEDVEISDKYSSWFTPEELHDTTEEEVIIEEGTFEKCDDSDGVTLDIEWWWNTSYYVGIPSDDEKYYTKAYKEYCDLDEAFDRAHSEYYDYLEAHNFGEIEDEYGEITEGFSCDCVENHEAESQVLYKNMNDLEDERDSHIFNEYISYDEKAVDYLEDNAVKILFYINGDQVAPGISGD